MDQLWTVDTLVHSLYSTTTNWSVLQCHDSSAVVIRIPPVLCMHVQTLAVRNQRPFAYRTGIGFIEEPVPGTVAGLDR
jgi:hypothetical protein